MSTVEHYSMLINGSWVDAADGAKIDSANPATGEIWATIPAATEKDVNAAVAAASAALNGPWGSMTPTQRGKCLHKLGDLLAENSEHLGRHCRVPAFFWWCR